MNKNKNTALWVTIVVIVVVVAAVGIGYYRYHKNQQEEQAIEGATPIATGDASSTASGSDNGGAGATGLVSDVTASSLSYAQAVAIFANYRVQFDENCRMTPVNMAVKNGTTIMFDNRYRNARTFKLDGVRYTLPGYGFKLFELTAGHIPHNIDVDCGTNQNSGKIDLE